MYLVPTRFVLVGSAKTVGCSGCSGVFGWCSGGRPLFRLGVVPLGHGHLGRAAVST